MTRNPAYYLNRVRRMWYAMRPRARLALYREKACIASKGTLGNAERARLERINARLGWAPKWLLSPEEQAEQIRMADEIIKEILEEAREGRHDRDDPLRDGRAAAR